VLMIAEGTLHHPVTDQDHRMAAEWLVPMIDAGSLHGAGWIQPNTACGWRSAPQTWLRRSSVSPVYPLRRTAWLPSRSPK
jgi:hypothetical protein